MRLMVNSDGNALSGITSAYNAGDGIDVASGVALAAGGFTTGAIAYVFNRDQYHAVIRPALLTAMLGYTFVVLGLLMDIGRYWNITSPFLIPKVLLFELNLVLRTLIGFKPDK